MCCLPLNQIADRSRYTTALFLRLGRLTGKEYDKALREYEKASAELDAILKEAWDELQGSVQTDN